MDSCLAHPQRRACDWKGHVHVNSLHADTVLAGWCDECSMFDQVVMYSRNKKRCRNCCGALVRFR
jgi:hypothetical protein